MVRRCLKNKSKRVTCHKRYKILRKVREHHRKIRKEAKKNPHQFKRKDPGVPTNYPFKEEFFKHVEDIKRKIDEVKSYNQTHGTKANVETENASRLPSCQDEITKVINDADVIIEVLDARDPLGTRRMDIEENILAANKRLVLLLNKIGKITSHSLPDLVPRSNLQLWLDYLRKTRTVLPFRSNTQQQNNYLCVGKMHWANSVDMKKQSPKGLGIDDLMSLLANYGRIDGGSERKHITVGVIGLPNTGKSSLVNTLKRQKVCASGNLPGLTKCSQRVRLDKNIFLIDSPGILTSRSSDLIELALKNCVKPESLEDPIPAVEAILRRCDQNQLISKYKIDSYNDVTDFVAQLAHRLGKLRKGGLPNLTQAARALITDWITGKITYFTVPPENPNGTPDLIHNTEENLTDELHEHKAEMEMDDE